MSTWSCYVMALAALAPILSIRAYGRVQESALSTIASVAATAEGHFSRYAAATLPVLKHFMMYTTDVHLATRARATECLGLVCAALGREAVRPVLGEYLPLALQGLQLDYAELREYTYGFFAALADALGPEIAQYLEVVVPAAVDSVDSNDMEAEETLRRCALHRLVLLFIPRLPGAPFFPPPALVLFHRWEAPRPLVCVPIMSVQGIVASCAAKGPGAAHVRRPDLSQAA